MAVREGAVDAPIVARDEVSLYPVKAGSDALTAALSNEAHSLQADNSGEVNSYSGSGTAISVYQGSTELQFEVGTGFPSTNGKFRVVPTATNITSGAISVSGKKAIVADSSNMTNDTAQIDFQVNNRNSKCKTSTITKEQ